MLPVNIQVLRDRLKAKGLAKRTRGEDALYDELNLVDKALDDLDKKDKNAIAPIQKEVKGHSVYGPTTDVCPTCGKNW